MVPRRRQSQAKPSYIAGALTDPSSKWFKDHTNNTSVAQLVFKEKNPAPPPATMLSRATTPVSKSGTLIQDDGNGARERAISQMQRHGVHHK